MYKIIPALPTIIVAFALSYDFAGIKNKLYLSILFYYIGIVCFLILSLLYSYIKTKSAFSTLSLSISLLLFATISFLFVPKPASFFISNFTHWNRAVAKIDLKITNENLYEFTVIGIGRGSKESLILNSGYTNIAINKNYGRGPSLNYKLQPVITFFEQSGCATEEYSIDEIGTLFNKLGLNNINSEANISIFLSALYSFQKTTSVNQPQSFIDKKKHFSISLIPFENAVYRTSFLLISTVIVILSIALGQKNKNK